MRDPGDDGDAAALDGELHEARSFAKLDMQEFAGRAEDHGALYAAPGEEVDEVQHGSEIGLVSFEPVLGNGGGEDSLELGWLGHGPVSYLRVSGVRITFRISTWRWSPCRMMGPGSPSLGSMAMAVKPSMCWRSMTLWSFNTTVTSRPTRRI